MNIVKSIFTCLPEKMQDRIMEAKCKDGSVFKMPVFKMLLHSLEFFGADLAEIKEAFTSPYNKSRSLIDIFRLLGEKAKKAGEDAEKQDNKEDARLKYHRAAIYYLCADWFTYNRESIALNYQLMIPCYDKFRAFSEPQIDKIEFPFTEGTLNAFYRVPKTDKDRMPAVILIQGNDEVKEFNSRFEELALAKNMAVLDLDPPGWGESGVTGNRCRSYKDYQKAINIAVDFLQNQKEINPRSIGIFGVSFGGLLSPYAAGLDSRLAAAVGLGGPCFSTVEKTNRIRKPLPSLQKKRSYLYADANSEQEMLEWTARMDFARVLSKTKCSVLLVHGEKDELVSPANAYDNARIIQGQVTVKVIPGGDHMCTQVLEREVGPFMFDWLANTLR